MSEAGVLIKPNFSLRVGLKLLTHNVVVAVCYVLLALPSMRLATYEPVVSPIWLPFGVAVVALILYSERIVFGVLIGALFAYLLADSPFFLAGVIALAETIGAWCGAWLCRKWCHDRDCFVNSLSGLGVLILGAGYGGGLISASLTVTVLYFSDLLSAGAWSAVWLTKWLGMALGVLLLGPFILAWHYREIREIGHRLLRWRIAEGVTIAAVVVGLAWLSFTDVGIRLPNAHLQFYVVVPALIWLGLRFSPSVSSSIIVLVSFVVLSQVLAEHDVATQVAWRSRVEVAHVFLLITGVTALVLSVLMVQRAREHRMMEESEARFRALAALSSDWYWELDADLRFSRVDGAGSVLTGIAPEERIGRRPWELPLNDLNEPAWVEQRRRIEARQPFYDFLIRRRDEQGDCHFARISGEPMFDAAGSFLGYRGVGRNVTREVRAVEALRASEQRFRSLTQLSSDWYWEQDASFRFTRVDGPGMERMGIREEELIGYRRWDMSVFVESEAFWQAHKAMLEAYRPFRDLLLRRKGPEGRLRYAMVTGEPVFDTQANFIGYRGVGRDVTTEMEARDALRASEQRLRTLLEASADLIAMKDAQGHWIVANQAMLRICGLEQVQWQGRTDAELTRLSRTGRVLPTASSQTKILNYDANELSRCEETINDPDGTARTFEFVTNQVGGALGRLECVIVIGREVTHFKRAERIQQHQMEVIRRLNDELESRVAARTAALETANRELEAFSYSVSHDLRAPLRALNGFSRLLEEDFGDRLGGEAIVYLERIRRAAERMGELIDDLLKLSRISRAQIKRQPFDLSVAAKGILDELGEAESASRRFDFVIQDSLNVEADPGLVRVLLENLLRNAWKFSRRSDPTRIEFGRIIRRGKPYYFVRDNGAGFDMEHASRLFAPFQRLHSQDDYEGSGIGLAIVQRIVRLHGGEVEAESRAGAGATFYFSLSIPELDAAYQWDVRS